MAVSKVRKLEILAHGEWRDEVLTELRKTAAVHISNVSELYPEWENNLPSFLEISINQAEEKLSTLRHCLDIGMKYLPKRSLPPSLLKSRPIFTPHEADAIVAEFELERFSGECGLLEKELQENENQIARKGLLIEEISLWLPLRWQLERIQDTRCTRISLGICDARTYPAFARELAEASPLHHIEVVEISRSSVSMVLIYAKELEDLYTPIMRKFAWRSVQFSGLTGAPQEIRDRLREQIKELHERNQRIKERIVEEFLPVRNELLLLYDHYLQETHTLKVQRNFLFTQRTFAINGWVLAAEEERLKRRLNELTRDIEVRCSDPGPRDVVPILLKNPPAIKPFSLITELYGRPQYSEFDPTPFLAPFFIFFFGICMGDAGYGIVLTVASLIGLKKLRPKGSARLLLQIIAWGGLATFIVGIFTGGVFAIPSDKLPTFLRSMMIFEPTRQVLQFLYLTFLIGLCQIIFGLILKIAKDIHDRDYFSAVFDEGLWIFVIVAAAPLVYKYLFGGKVSEQALAAAKTTALVFVGPLVLGRGRKSKIYFMPLMGTLNVLRDTLGFFGDTLSYARLMALGLSGAFLAMTVNDIASLVLPIPYGIGIVMAIFILVFGHTFNIVINALGGFVHSLRLQYLEFFSKFFTGGGRPFEPFAEVREHTVVRSELE
ncbi:MAG: V-type ATP synthase subunit I [Candidatus Abyssobacteria bacterium SURF_5]|uniref:V-type ATP synthase subunit I n=1 Tax=Abyssobacteria bacterium (strain SURF_5) TaxID=2093360 RepID=A0A3A4P4A8_ABYX5|nr:MAG: V-type ATP synthase subunit I [Candidatus Abyssubacteria bacterium SURF_5]